MIRWWESELGADGKLHRALRYEALEAMSRRAASEILAQRVAAAGNNSGSSRSRVKFEAVAGDWARTVLPMYKASNHRHITSKHLVPRFGAMSMLEVTPLEVQSYGAHVMQQDYPPKTIDHIHDVLSAILRTAVK